MQDDLDYECGDVFKNKKILDQLCRDVYGLIRADALDTAKFFVCCARSEEGSALNHLPKTENGIIENSQWPLLQKKIRRSKSVSRKQARKALNSCVADYAKKLELVSKIQKLTSSTTGGKCGDSSNNSALAFAKIKIGSTIKTLFNALVEIDRAFPVPSSNENKARCV